MTGSAASVFTLLAALKNFLSMYYFILMRNGHVKKWIPIPTPNAMESASQSGVSFKPIPLAPLQIMKKMYTTRVIVRQIGHTQNTL